MLSLGRRHLPPASAPKLLFLSGRVLTGRGLSDLIAHVIVEIARDVGLLGQVFLVSAELKEDGGVGDYVPNELLPYDLRVLAVLVAVVQVPEEAEHFVRHPLAAGQVVETNAQPAEGERLQLRHPEPGGREVEPDVAEETVVLSGHVRAFHLLEMQAPEEDTVPGAVCHNVGAESPADLVYDGRRFRVHIALAQRLAERRDHLLIRLRCESDTMVIAVDRKLTEPREGWFVHIKELNRGRKQQVRALAVAFSISVDRLPMDHLEECAGNVQNFSSSEIVGQKRMWLAVTLNDERDSLIFKPVCTSHNQLVGKQGVHHEISHLSILINCFGCVCKTGYLWSVGCFVSSQCDRLIQSGCGVNSGELLVVGQAVGCLSRRGC